MSADRVLFVVLLGFLVLLIGGMLALSGGTPTGPEGLAVLARTLIGVAVVVILARIVTAQGRR
jgi:hypothetical protein